jgi:DNA processing protein
MQATTAQAFISKQGAYPFGPIGQIAPNETGTSSSSRANSFFLDEEKFFLIALSKIEKLGPVKGRALVQRFESAKNLFLLPKKEILLIEGLSLQHKYELIKRSTLAAAESELRFVEMHGVDVLPIYSSRFPELLREIHDCPLVLYQRGGLNFNEHPGIAIVGTRKPSKYGEETAQRFAEAFATSGFNVISGMAYGIDACVHRSALKAGGLTTGVLGHGLSQIYPREHAGLSGQIVKEGGGLITEFGATVGPDAFNFPSRNRIISGLSHATLVIEAKEKGGALITAKMAFEQNRFVYAIPGNIGQQSSVGCNHLIRDQIAKLVTSPEDIVEDLLAVISLGPLQQVVSENEKEACVAGQGGDAVANQTRVQIPSSSRDSQIAINHGELKAQDAINKLLGSQLSGGFR